MVHGERFTIHRTLADEQFDDATTVDAFRLRLKQNGTYTDNVLNHAINAAGEADSASASLSAFQLPTLLSVLNSKRVLVGYGRPTAYLRQNAVKETNNSVVVAGTVFEAGFDGDGELLKLCSRYPYDPEHDQICVVKTDEEAVVTAWVNSTDDGHQTLDEEEYDAVDAVLNAQRN